MLAKEMLSDSILPLRTSDTALTAISMMEELKVSHLPIVNNEEFLGLISENDILEYNKLEDPLGNHKLSLTLPSVNENQHIFDVVKVFSDLKLTILPVLDKNNNYLGIITLRDLIYKLSQTIAVNNPGGIIILEVNQSDYMLSQIAHIIEENDAKVLCLYISSNPDTTKMEITVKINKMDIRPVLQTLNRYNYIVKATYTDFNNIENLKDRYDLLMNYLNM
ncbi:MAG: CBS domain-containing protein [Bacteroidales bacterium]|nr:CBS domain-containing protein [Bacteroidales bacterium]